MGIVQHADLGKGYFHPSGGEAGGFVGVYPENRSPPLPKGVFHWSLCFILGKRGVSGFYRSLWDRHTRRSREEGIFILSDGADDAGGGMTVYPDMKIVPRLLFIRGRKNPFVVGTPVTGCPRR